MKRVALLAAVVFLATSCAGTKLSSVWKNPDFHQSPRKIVVVSMVWDPKNRQRLDETFVRQMKARGLDAVPGYTILPEPKLPEKAVVAARIKETGADTLLFGKLVDKESSLHYVQEPGHYNPDYHGTWSSYYDAGYPTAVEREYAIAEVKLYDVASEQLIWSAVSKTKMSNATQDAIEAYVTRILDALKQDQVIP